MAAIGKIRSWGPILVAVIGLALFAFIAEELFRSCDSIKNDRNQQVGQVLGEKISMQEFQTLVEEYTEVIKVQQGQDNLSEDQLNQVRDMVWNTFVQTKIYEKEAKELGLRVTDAEMQNILKEGTNPMLLQTPFVNQQTGRFDVNALQKFLAEYKNPAQITPQLQQQYQTIYRYWTFVEKTLRQQTLVQKYQALLAGCFLSNPVEAKLAFQEENTESNIELAAFPYTSIDASKIEVTDAELQAKYDELKPRFQQYVETRDIKYVDVPIVASQQDRTALKTEMDGYAQQLGGEDDPAEIVRKSTSLIGYLGMPVAKTAFPQDIASKIDSMAVGAVVGPFENIQDNTYNVVKLIAKQELPDSVQYRQIQVGGATPEEAHQRADSILTALQGGAEFAAIAKVYGQAGTETWLTTAQYQHAPSLDADTREYLTSLNTLAVNEYKNIELPQGNIIVQVLDRKASISKYTVAVVKRTIDYSKDTRTAVFNKFNSFAAANMTADAISANAQKSGYKLLDAKDVTTAQHNLVNIRSTRDALKWVFSAKEGDVSPLYECGNNGDHLLIVILDKIHKEGYRGLDDPQVKELVKSEVIRDKQAEQLFAKIKGVNSIAAAKAKGANVSTVEQVTFAAPVFIAATGGSEPALSGAVAATAKGTFSKQPVKGNAGVYLFQVTSRSNRPTKFDAKAMEQKLRQRWMQYAGNFTNELYIKANVKDNRYLFF